MKLVKTKNFDEMSRVCADIIGAQVREKPDTVLGLATGGTPVGIYEYLALMYKNGLDFSRCRTVNLDEYEGLDANHPQSYAFFMRDNLFKYINIPAENLNIPNGMAGDAQAECERYERVVAGFGGADIQLLGIGHNGHIAFNEPSDHFPEFTNRVKLTPSTLEANARYFGADEQQPLYAFTMGIGTIMTAKKIVLAASGKGKAEIMKKTLYGPVTPEVPASVLRFHRDVTFVCDEDALSLCNM